MFEFLLTVFSAIKLIILKIYKHVTVEGNSNNQRGANLRAQQEY
jgi:hypothetical protein